MVSEVCREPSRPVGCPPRAAPGDTSLPVGGDTSADVRQATPKRQRGEVIKGEVNNAHADLTPFDMTLLEALDDWDDEELDSSTPETTIIVNTDSTVNAASTPGAAANRAALDGTGAIDTAINSATVDRPTLLDSTFGTLSKTEQMQIIHSYIASLHRRYQQTCAHPRMCVAHRIALIEIDHMLEGIDICFRRDGMTLYLQGLACGLNTVASRLDALNTTLDDATPDDSLLTDATPDMTLDDSLIDGAKLDSVTLGSTPSNTMLDSTTLDMTPGGPQQLDALNSTTLDNSTLGSAALDTPRSDTTIGSAAPGAPAKGTRAADEKSVPRRHSVGILDVKREKLINSRAKITPQALLVLLVS